MPKQDVRSRDGRPFEQTARDAAQRHGYQLDDAQVLASDEFNRLYQELVINEKNSRSLFRMWRRDEPARGIYLWGGVGRGKSFLMDVFFESVPIKQKTRTHFHRFMQDIHHRLSELQGRMNPLRLVGAELAAENRLLCLDEFHVTDIGDAMLLRYLLESLFAQGVALVTTSNLQPEKLYENGLQRAQFLPAIDLIGKHMAVLNLDGGSDYRLAMLEKAGVFHSPCDEEAEAAMLSTFCDVGGDEGAGSSETIEIEGRPIPYVRLAQGAVWFEFDAICDGPRGQADYIELARRFHTVLVSHVPCFSRENANARRRFTWLVDEFYDRRVKLVLSAHAELPEIFSNADGSAESDRTVSRLIEMRARKYLGLAHLS
jgi:cell division protein ZapE